MSGAFLIGPGGQISQIIGERGETPPCPDAQFQRGAVVRVKNRKGIAHFPREAVVLAVVPPGFPPDWALADLVGDTRPVMHQVGKPIVQYILGTEESRTPYLISDRDLIPSGKPPVTIGAVERERGA